MAYTTEEYGGGELLVINEAKGVWQIIPNVERPYNLVYVPENNNVYALKDLSELGDGATIQHIKVVN